MQKTLTQKINLSEKRIAHILTAVISMLLILSLSLTSICSYFITKASIRNDFIKSSSQVLDQTKKYIEIKNTTVDITYSQMYSDKQFMNLISNIYADDNTKLKNTDSIMEKLKYYTINNTFNIISGITFYSPYGLTTSFPYVPRTIDESNSEMENIKNTSWYDKVIEMDGKPYWLAPHEEKIVDGRPDSYLSSISVIKSENGDTVLGILKIDIKANVLEQIIKNVTIGKSGTILIVNSNNELISQSNSSLFNDEVFNIVCSKLSNTSNEDFSFYSNGRSYYGNFINSDYNDWRYIVIIPQSELSSTAVHIQKYTSIITIIFLIISIIVALAISNLIKKPIYDLIGLTRELSNGNLTVTSPNSTIKELNLLSQNFDTMAKKLTLMMKKTKDISIDTNAISSQLANLTEDMTHSAKEVSSAMEQIAVSSNEQVQDTSDCINTVNLLSDNLNSIIANIKSVISDAERNIEMVDDNKNIICELSSTSTINSENISNITETISQLSDSTKSIIYILSKINDITEQTNLLALNASIEAARAGEAGKGFAVVADEIRLLSEKSQKSSIEIDTILSSINEKINFVLNIVNKTKLDFDNEAIQVNNTVKSFELINDSIVNTKTSMTETLINISEIEENNKKLFNNIYSIESSTEHNAAATEEVMASMENQTASNENMSNIAKDLNTKSELLLKELENFKIE